MTTGIVAVPARLESLHPEDSRVQGAQRSFHDIIMILRTVGLEPVVVTEPGVSLDGIDGVVLPGGGDLDPQLYGGAPCDAVYDVNPAQDLLDLEVGRRALDLDLPALGICRGAQVLNVAAGGTLYADLEPTTVAHRCIIEADGSARLGWHRVDLDPESALYAACGGPTDIDVASGHHQGIDRLGRGFRVTATAPDGLTEAFEDETGRRIGVQWHPEAGGVESGALDAAFVAFAHCVLRRGQDEGRRNTA